MCASTVCVLVLLAACADNPVVEPGPGASYPAPPPSTDLDGVRGSLLVGAWADGQQEVAVWMEADGRVGAYQARLRFERPALRYERAASSDEGFRVLNDVAAESGELRFAGFDVSGFEDREVLRVRFAVERPIEPEQLALSLEAVGTLEGEPVAGRRLSVELDLYALPER